MIDLDKAGKKATGLKDPNKSLYKYKKDGKLILYKKNLDFNS